MTTQQCGFPHTDLPMFTYGCADAVRRLASCAELRVPLFLLHPDFAVAQEGVRARLSHYEKQALARELCRFAADRRGVVAPAPAPAPAPAQPDCERRVTALLRLLVGDALEAFADGSSRGWRSAETQTAAQLFADSYQAALWTSAHAAYIDMLKQHGAGGAPPAPTLAAVPSAATHYNLSELFTRRANPKTCVKEAQPMLMLLQRSMSPGHRGWDTGLVTALKHRGTALVLRHSVLCCLLGMHPQLEPRNRPHWRIRMKALRVLDEVLKPARVAETFVACSIPVKEALRRSLASALARSTAEHAALATLGHPVRHLLEPPFALPSGGQLSAMAAFARAGSAFAEGATDVAHTINKEFNAQALSFEKEPRFDASWMNRGITSVQPRVTLASLATSTWLGAFRAHFLPFWAFCASYNQRITRLDALQHNTLRGLSAATALCNTLDEATALKAQRAALRCPSAALVTPQQAVAVLGIDVAQCESAPCHYPASVLDALLMLKAEVGGQAKSVAQMLVFARAAASREAILTVRLGAACATRQARAVMRRFGFVNEACTVSDDAAVEWVHKWVPLNGYAAYLCRECRRVATAHVNIDNTRAGGAFNEIGVSAAMFGAKGCADIRCAKRSSSALRAAIENEHRMHHQAPELFPENDNGLKVVLSGRSTENGGSVRIRRDTKSCFEQASSANACGSTPMLVVPLLGRVVRIFEDWMGLCVLCGAMVMVKPHHRFGGDICCLRCDPNMLYGEEEIVLVSKKVEAVGAVCRYCGRYVRSVNKCPSTPLCMWRRSRQPRYAPLCMWRRSRQPRYAPLCTCMYTGKTPSEADKGGALSRRRTMSPDGTWNCQRFCVK